MDPVVCPKCGTENPANAMNCRNCRINLRFALEHPDEIERTKWEEIQREGTARPGEPRRRKPAGCVIAGSVLASILLLAACAIASFLTTMLTWDGGFPSGEFRLNIRDSTGAPIQGATLHVYEKGTRNPAFEYPIDNYLSGHDLTSDEQGQIVAVREYGGVGFGGFGFQLFWTIPIITPAPDYDCEITATGYKPIKFSIWRLFESNEQILVLKK